VEDLLIRILSEMGYPVLLQGGLPPGEEYPENFFTYWNNESPDAAFYNNKAHQVIWGYDVNFYTSNPAFLYIALADAKEKLKQSGFIVPSNGHSLASDEPTHTGRGMPVYYLKNKED